MDLNFQITGQIYVTMIMILFISIIFKAFSLEQKLSSNVVIVARLLENDTEKKIFE